MENISLGYVKMQKASSRIGTQVAVYISVDDTNTLKYTNRRR